MQHYQITMQDNFFIENLKQSLGMRFLLFLIILLICSLIGVALSAMLVFAGDTGMRIAQGLSSIMMFVVPPIVYYFLTRKENQMQALGFRKLTPPWWLIFIGVALMLVSIPVTATLTIWNESMTLGGAFSRLEEWMKELEETARVLTEDMLNVDTFGGMLLNFVIIALIPAIGEEMTFRGVLQQSLTRKMNPHIAILLSSAIFSFIHFQFYGFLPRMFLGMLLGYMFYITNSLWTCILMHFVNNGASVVIYYLGNKGIIEDVEHFGETDNIWIITASAIITIALIVWSWKKTQPKQVVSESTSILPNKEND